MMGISLADRGALVAGGDGGIGRAVCAGLRAAGAHVVAVDRVASTATPDHPVTLCDLTDAAAVASAVREVHQRLGRLDVVVHCAGVTRDAALVRMTDEEWRAVMATNLDSAFYLLRSVGPVLRAGGGGAVVLVSSINAERGKAGQGNYAASKAGLTALGRTAAREWGRHHIRVNMVAPGWTETAMTAPLPDELKGRALGETALGRLGQPTDVAGAVVFLCSDLASHVTGQTLRVDGGQLIG